MNGPGTVGRESKVAPSPRGTFHGAVDANGQTRALRVPVAGGVVVVGGAVVGGVVVDGGVVAALQG